jgi:hypothetical protein
MSVQHVHALHCHAALTFCMKMLHDDHEHKANTML